MTCWPTSREKSKRSSVLSDEFYSAEDRKITVSTFYGIDKSQLGTLVELMSRVNDATMDAFVHLAIRLLHEPHASCGHCCRR